MSSPLMPLASTTPHKQATLYLTAVIGTMNFNLLIIRISYSYLSTVDMTKAPDFLLLIQQFCLPFNILNDHHVSVVAEQISPLHFNIKS